MTLNLTIGETLYPNDDNSNPQICGAIVQSRKKMDRVGLWTRDAENEQGNGLNLYSRYCQLDRI